MVNWRYSPLTSDFPSPSLGIFEGRTPSNFVISLRSIGRLFRSWRQFKTARRERRSIRPRTSDILFIHVLDCIWFYYNKREHGRSNARYHIDEAWRIDDLIDEFTRLFSSRRSSISNLNARENRNWAILFLSVFFSATQLIRSIGHAAW